MSQVLEEIRAEREYQDEQWGTEFDDKNTLNDWAMYVNVYMAQAAAMTCPPEQQQKNMLKAATLLVAVVETFDRNGGFAPRHYEDRVPAGTRPIENLLAGPIQIRRTPKDDITSVKEEIAIVRMAVEKLLNSTESDKELCQRIQPTLNTLIRLIERLVLTAHKIEAKSERPG